MNQDFYKVFAKKLMKENLNPEEEKFLNEIIQQDTITNENYKIINEFWNNFHPVPFENKVTDITFKKLGFKNSKSSFFKTTVFYQIAATVLLLITFGLAGLVFQKEQNNFSLKEYSSLSNEIKHFELSDGTKVWLNNGSSLYTIEPFKGKNRSVKLIGEAYFEVASNPKKPFIVETKGLKTEVLGTTFNINSWTDTKVQEIELYEGKIKIKPDEGHKDTFILMPGQRIKYNSENGDIQISKIKKTKTAGWREGILEFNNDELYYIALQLGRKYKTQIIFTNNSNTGNLRFTAEFTNETLEEILQLLSEAKYFNYKINKQGIIIQ